MPSALHVWQKLATGVGRLVNRVHGNQLIDQAWTSLVQCVILLRELSDTNPHFNSGRHVAAKRGFGYNQPTELFATL